MSQSEQPEQRQHARQDQPPPDASLPREALPRIIPVEQLLGQDDEVLILCGSQLYRLRRTRQGKLILHK